MRAVEPSSRSNNNTNTWCSAGWCSVEENALKGDEKKCKGHTKRLTKCFIRIPQVLLAIQLLSRIHKLADNHKKCKNVTMTLKIM